MRLLLVELNINSVEFKILIQTKQPLITLPHQQLSVILVADIPSALEADYIKIIVLHIEL
jgi:hypothetical protein